MRDGLDQWTGAKRPADHHIESETMAATLHLPDLDRSRDSLFLDFDGTLVGFSQDPQAVRLAPETAQSIGHLADALEGAVAIVTGRPIAFIDGLLDPLLLPMAGIHGFEMRTRPDGAVQTRQPPPDLARVRAILTDKGEQQGLRIEDKGGAIVLHFRGAEHLEPEARALAEHALAGAEGLVLVPGHAIIEVRPESVDKGGAIAALSDVPPFRGRRPIFIGDDRTDEDGFVRAQDRGGFGVKVGSGETSARFRLEDIEAVHHWLKRQETRLLNHATSA